MTFHHIFDKAICGLSQERQTQKSHRHRNLELKLWANRKWKVMPLGPKTD